MTKAEIRQHYLNKRKQLSPLEIKNKQRGLLKHCALYDLSPFSIVHLFLSIQKQREPNTQPLIEHLFFEGKTVVASRSDFNTKQMTHWAVSQRAYGKPVAMEFPSRPKERLYPLVRLTWFLCLCWAMMSRGNAWGMAKAFTIDSYRYVLRIRFLWACRIFHQSLKLQIASRQTFTFTTVSTRGESFGFSFWEKYVC